MARRTFPLRWTPEVDIAVFVMVVGLFVFILGLSALFMERRFQANQHALEAQVHQRMCAEWVGPLPQDCRHEHP
jgi:hypothetical protein